MHSVYSPYVTPGSHKGNRCLVVDYRLRDLEPRAWKFLVDFAEDNNLQTDELGGKNAKEQVQTPA